MKPSTFPGGTSVSFLDVYEDAAPDGLCGGSPHMHLASTECYVVIAGRGTLHSIDATEGYRQVELQAGVVVWFTPGTIHRAVNYGGLQVVVLMGNAGLPEAGDAVMTFPAPVVADAERYRVAATLPDTDSPEEKATAARIRRDLAVTGFTSIHLALADGDAEPLQEFYASAARLIGPRAHGWERIVRDGPLGQATETLAVVRALAAGNRDNLEASRVRQAPEPPAERGFGMCGRLRPYDVTTGVVEQ